MHTIKLVVEYDGGGFHGWQVQPGIRTVQGELDRVLRIILKSEIGPLHAAGRTDAGVHARGQVVAFRCSFVPDLWRLQQGVSHLLKGELAVLSAEEVAYEFHPGRCATHKQYTYTILNRRVPAVIDARRVWHFHRPLDVDWMRREAGVLVGEHDFTSLRDSECSAGSPIKTIYSSDIITEGDLIFYRVIGSGFLKQMVRNIVGTLIDLQRGVLKDPDMAAILAAHDRRRAGATAPPHGLCMDWVSYASAPELSSRTTQSSRL